MEQEKYIGMDVHKALTVIAVRNSDGKVVAEAIIETKGVAILGFIKGQQFGMKNHRPPVQGVSHCIELIRVVFAFLENQGGFFVTVRVMLRPRNWACLKNNLQVTLQRNQPKAGCRSFMISRNSATCSAAVLMRNSNLRA